MMKKIVIIIYSFLILSCSKEEIGFIGTEVSYKVITEDGLWYGNYIDGNGDEVCLCEEDYLPSEWTHTFHTDRTPLDLEIEAVSEYYNDNTRADKPNITVMIFVDGELQVSTTNSLEDGRAGARYPDEVVFLNN